MTRNAYALFGWLVWQLRSRRAKRKIAQNRSKIGALGVVALVLIGGVVAAKVTGNGDD